MARSNEIWHLETQVGGYATLTMDVPGKPQNTLGREALEKFETYLDEIEKSPPKALFIRSGKESGFMAGADIEELSGASAEDLRALIDQGHKALNRLEALPCPTIAVIHGVCLGGGLEVAFPPFFLPLVPQSLVCAQPLLQLALLHFQSLGHALSILTQAVALGPAHLAQHGLAVPAVRLLLRRGVEVGNLHGDEEIGGDAATALRAAERVSRRTRRPASLARAAYSEPPPNLRPLESQPAPEAMPRGRPPPKGGRPR